MTFEPMIHLYQTKLQEATEEAVLEMVWSEVTKKGVMVKALRYDRGQYEKGYADGRADAQKWISAEDERKPKHGERVLCRYVFSMSKEPFVSVLNYYTHGDNGYVTGAHFTDEGVLGMRVTHWMPLPQPPKEDERGYKESE